MKKIFKQIIISSLFTSVFVVKVYPQAPKGNAQPVPLMQIVGKAGMGVIQLRWAAAGVFSWQAGNRYGYMIERYTVSRNGHNLPKPEKRLLTPEPVKPLPLAAWQEAAQRNDYAAAFASALYDTAFEVSSKQDGVSSIVSKLTVTEQRYNIALLSADMSFEAARMGGLAFTDSTVKPGEKYLYRLYTKIPRNILRTDTLALFIGLDDYRTLPAPDDILAVAGDKQVMLSWNWQHRAAYYNAYVVEKSIDGGQTFRAVNEKPVLPFSNTAGTDKSALLYFGDTLAQNDVPVQYRIKGISLFGEESPYSNIVVTSGKTELFAQPGITGAEFLKGDSIKLAWELPHETDSLLTGYNIDYAPTAAGPFTTIVQQLPSQSRTYLFATGEQAGYYRVAAHTKYGTVKNSFPYLIQPEDNTPPAPVQGFTGSIDSNGIVTLNWQLNTEKDLAGYKLYKTIRQGDEYAVLTDTLYTATSFRDTLSLHLLNSKVYYNIVALDNRANASSMPAPLVIHKPDRAAPEQPVLKNYEVTNKGITLYWHRSNSEDVAAHCLLRRQDGKQQWDTLAVITDILTEQYTDETAAPAATYDYTIISRDESGLRSEPGPVYRLTAANKDAQKIVLKVAAVANREQRRIDISWTYTTIPIKQLELYRGEGKTPLSLYQILENGETAFADNDLKVNNLYTYAIRAVLPDGKYTDLKTVTINY